MLFIHSQERRKKKNEGNALYVFHNFFAISGIQIEHFYTFLSLLSTQSLFQAVQATKWLCVFVHILVILPLFASVPSSNACIHVYTLSAFFSFYVPGSEFTRPAFVCVCVCLHMHLLYALEAQMYIHLMLVPAVKLQRGLKDPPHRPLTKRPAGNTHI